MPDPRRPLRRFTDTRLLARVTAHLSVLALVVLSAGFGIAVTRDDGTSALPAQGARLLNLVGIARAGGEAAPSADQFQVELVPDPTDEELPNRDVPRATASPTPAPVPATPAPRPSESAAPLEAAEAVGGTTADVPLPSLVPSPVAEPVAPDRLTWPVIGGQISQYFHAGHLALDIAAASGNPVVAAGGGFVTFAGWMDNGGGNVVIIDHGAGMQTVYNHLGGFAVTSGTYVGAGQTIGSVGCTGMCTGPHVHFEVIVGGVIVNPLRHL